MRMSVLLAQSRKELFTIHGKGAPFSKAEAKQNQTQCLMYANCAHLTYRREF